MSFMLTRELSRNGIFSFIINSEASLINLNRKEKRGVRPIVVVVLTAVEDIHRFIRYKNSYNISYPLWLMIFTDQFGSAICGYCNKPTNNFLGLLFDTQMLVVCCNDSSLQEWWSDHRNQTETVSIGEWTVEDGLKSITNQSLYTRRSEVNGVGFRIGIVTVSCCLFPFSSNFIILPQIKQDLIFTTLINGTRRLGSMDLELRSILLFERF